VVDKHNIPFGAASDGDGDRNMIYGANAFVSPGDSLAIIAHHAHLIPYFKKNGVFGLARSMPTSGAVDLVAKKQGLNCYEVPTGWKFFCALFDSDKLSICGEESFGTGSNHIREKDGLWAVVAWLNVIAGIGVQNPGVTPSIKQIQKDFWTEYGRTFFTRYDYEDVDSDGAAKVVGTLKELVDKPDFIGSKIGDREVTEAGNFSYTDLDGSVSSGQGLYAKFSSGSRIVVRLSGTGSSGATIRLYIEQYSNDPSTYDQDAQDFLKPEIKFATELLKFKEYVGRDEPDVPTGWKFFCALFDSDKLSICGEESFGTGSNHIREKDGLWAVVAWLNVIAGIGVQNPGVTPSIKQIQKDFWTEYGRTFFTRYDYEDVDSDGAAKVVGTLKSLVDKPDFIGSKIGDREVTEAGNFSYTDLDGSVSSGQGLYAKFSSGSRIVVRLSGTGSSGATIRLYIEQYSNDPSTYDQDAQDFLKPEIKFATELLKFKEYVGRDEPDVKT
ncbi:hypothetical protein BN1708_016442, partial [Verticillium longisporum]